jgi:hypothetical protein
MELKISLEAEFGEMMLDTFQKPINAIAAMSPKHNAFPTSLNTLPPCFFSFPG